MTEHRPPGRRRFLTDAEIDLWLQVTHGVTQMPGRQLPEKATAGPAAPPPPKPTGALPGLPASPPRPRPKPEPLPAAHIDRRLRQRLSRGRIQIEAAVDLHGMRQDMAHQALIGFLLRARSEGKKLVLVVTGKGRTAVLDASGLGREAGVLRRAVPHWLQGPELRNMVIGFEPAAALHGGSGALYIRLRRADRPPSRSRP